MEAPDIGSAFNSGNDSGITSDQDRPDTGPPNPLPQQPPPVYYCMQAPNYIHGTGMTPPYAYHPIGPNMMLPMTFRPRTIPDIPGDPNMGPVSMPVNMTSCFRNGVPASHFPMNYGEIRYPAFGVDPNYQFSYQHHATPPGLIQTSAPVPCPVSSPRSGHESPDHFKDRQRDGILSPALVDCVALVKDESGSSSVVSCSIGGDSECSGFRGKKKNGGKKKNDGWINKQCTFCKMTGKPTQVYQGHLCKNHLNEVTCPALMQIVCPCCFKTGKNAHTLQECEVFMAQMKTMMMSVVRDIMASQDAR